jgi:hypothetical protein
MISQQVMKIFINHDYIVSQSLDYGLDTFVTSSELYRIAHVHPIMACSK